MVLAALCLLKSRMRIAKTTVFKWILSAHFCNSKGSYGSDKSSITAISSTKISSGELSLRADVVFSYLRFLLRLELCSQVACCILLSQSIEFCLLRFFVLKVLQLHHVLKLRSPLTLVVAKLCFISFAQLVESAKLLGSWLDFPFTGVPKFALDSFTALQVRIHCFLSALPQKRGKGVCPSLVLSYSLLFCVLTLRCMFKVSMSSCR